MKFRLVDLLQCPCGKEELSLDDTVTKQVPFTDSLTDVICSKVCAFRQRRIGDGSIRPADCAECYSREVVEGTISCTCGQKWSITGGIPRFLPKDMARDFKKTQATFSFEWKMFRFGERNWAQDMLYRKNLFLRGMAVGPGDLKGKLILDAGCGSGLLAMEMAKSFGMEVVALDLASGIEKAYEKNDSPYVYFLQGSVLERPVRDRTFDYLYCAGVLVHLPSTEEGFKEIVKSLKEGGRCFIWVYHPIDSAHHPNDVHKIFIYNFIRKYFTCHLPIRIQYCLYLSLMPAFLLKQSIEIAFRKKKNRSTWREKMQALFDFFSPIYQNRHTAPEVLAWFAAEGFRNAEVAYTEKYGFAVRANVPFDSPASGEVLDHARL